VNNSPVRPSISTQRKPILAGAVEETAASEVQKDEVLAGDENDAPDEEDLQQEGNIEKVKLAPSPVLPTDKEIEEHNITHWPFRSWCKWCVLSRALGEQRGRARQDEVEHSVLIIGMDYFYLTSEGVNGWSEMLKFLELEDDARGHARVQQLMDDKEIVKCLIVCDYTSKAVFATVIGQKGHDDEEYSVNFILEAIKWLGYSTIIVKSDNEPAMLKLVKVAVQRLRVSLETVREEHSKEYDSKAHGGTETRIRSVRMLFRTLRSYLESQIGKKIPIFHPILAWLLSYTATLQNIVARGSDGRTPWSTIKGRQFNGRLAAFGEMCRWKLPNKGPAARNRGNMEVQSEEGIFLGINWNVNEYLYATAEGIQGSRSLTRVPFEQRWSLEAISAIAATPWQLKVPRDPEVIFPQDVPKEAPPRHEILPVRRL